MLFSFNPNHNFNNDLQDVLDHFSRKNSPVNPFKNFGNTAVNIVESPEKFIIELTAPGFEKENFSAHIESKTLIVKGEVKSEKETEQAYKRKEFQTQSFQRSFTLPENIEESAIDAQYKNGILFIEIPKKEVEKPKEIIIKVN